MKQATTTKRAAVKSPKSKNRIETPLDQTVYLNEDFYRKVQEVAYQLYLERGCAHGYDVDDWAKAEQIVKGS